MGQTQRKISVKLYENATFLSKIASKAIRKVKIKTDKARTCAVVTPPERLGRYYSDPNNKMESFLVQQTLKIITEKSADNPNAPNRDIKTSGSNPSVTFQ